jgi:hypothetical protein
MADRAARPEWVRALTLELHLTQKQKRESPATPTNRISLHDAKKRKLIADAERAELGLNVAGGELIQVDQVVRSWTKQAEIVRGHLRALPARVAPLVAASTSASECRDPVASD